ncbi:MAG: hypothetical protein V1854_04905 [Methanobacteriota archaeon]
MRSTVRIPQDSRHRHIITVPVEIWEGEELTEGDLIEVDIRKLKGVRHRGEIFMTEPTPMEG